MSKIARIMQQATAGAGGAGLDVDEVFSTYLWAGNSTNSRNIVNGIDVSGEGGLVWIKDRTVGDSNSLFTTDRGANKTLLTDTYDAEDTVGTSVFESFNSNGFTVGSHGRTNENNRDYVSWTFRKAPKFFDVVTYTGNGSNRTIAHNLGSDVGMIFIKKTNGIKSWAVFHRQFNSGSSPANYWDQLNNAQAIQSNSDIWNNTAPTSSVFSVGTANAVNDPGGTYVAYLFAHNNNDGGFGPDSDQDIIKCGSYTGTGAAGNFIDLGFEPQWLMTKSATGSENWIIQDNMRSMTDTDYAWLRANLSNAEIGGAFSGGTAAARPTGFVINNTGTSNNGSGSTYIYMAIRRGPLAEPTSATDVFQPVVSNVPNPNMVSTNLSYIDMAISKKEAGGQSYVQTRLTGDAFFKANGTDAETTGTSLIEFDHNNKMRAYFDTYGSDHINYFWKRAPGFFDVVAYTGNSVAGRNINHNLGVAPEMMWVKRRSDANNCTVYHKGLDATAPEDYGIYLDDSAQRADSVNFWNDTAPTSSVFTVGTASKTNANTATYIAYLFATLAGVSKVGSFSHTVNTATNVDCGFTSGARFVLAKQSDGSGNWWVWDTERGIVAGNDNRLALNTTGAENTNNDDIDPYSAGFTWAATWSTGTYIFYAIA